ncbi:hypothetical protein ASE57_06050 [Sphingomonas sp. Leaf11]|nr:hypothetical protein ASE58_06055 [Sphingomonas sp. Leaf9]KQM44239.1 hypothetical protein ASE57_06050 [Sphingomonas sp. Leaf11]
MNAWKPLLLVGRVRIGGLDTSRTIKICKIAKWHDRKKLSAFIDSDSMACALDKGIEARVVEIILTIKPSAKG